MLKTIQGLIVLSLLDLSLGSAFAYEGKTTFMTHSVEGKVYINSNGELRGEEDGGRRAFNIELVREMMILMEHPVRFEIVPFKRGRVALKEPKMALFNITRTEAREHLYKWVGPLQVDNVYFYQSKNKRPHIQSFSQARFVDRICVMRGTAQYENLTSQGFTNLFEINHWATCLKMVASGRMDLVPVSDSLLEAMMREAEVDSDDIQRTSVIVQVNTGYIAFSKDHADDVIKKWQMALDELKASGRYEELINIYLY